jgi:hypothetical protein
MILPIRYNKGAVMQALRYHFITRKELRIMIITVNVFALLSIILYIFGKIFAMAFLVSSLLWFVLMISFWFILPSIIYSKTTLFKHEFQMEFNKSGFSMMHQQGSKNWHWSALKNHLESPHFFHLYFDERTFFLIPKDVVRNDAELLELRALIVSGTSPSGSAE